MSSPDRDRNQSGLGSDHELQRTTLTGEGAGQPGSAPAAEPTAIATGGPSDYGPRNYVRPDNLILDDVARTLALDRAVDSSLLDVECRDGIVRISGTAPSVRARDWIEVSVACVFGIRELRLEIESDKGITAAAEDYRRSQSLHHEPAATGTEAV